MKYMASLFLFFYLLAFPALSKAQVSPLATPEPVQYNTRLPTPKSLTSDFSSPQTIQIVTANNGEPIINRTAIEWLVIFGLAVCVSGLVFVRRRYRRFKAKK